MQDRDTIKGQLISAEPPLLSKHDWEKIFNTIPDMITIHDKDFNIIKANEAAKKILGLPMLEVTKTKCFKYYHGADSPLKRCPSCQCLKTRKPATFEIFEPHLKMFLEIRAMPRFNSNNEWVGLIHIVRDITKRKKTEEKLRTLSISDELTGLLNRRGFFTFLEQQCKLADRTKRGMSLLYLDLDGMKEINDELGHKAGDLALMDTANILKKTFRKSDIIARIGGDEFVVLLIEHPELNIEDTIIKKLKDNLRIHNEQGGRSYELSLSIGITYYSPEHPCSPEDLLAHADKLMYEDKKNHKPGKKQAKRLFKGKERERREYRRVSPGKNYWAEIDNAGKVRIKDISIGGICLETSQYLDADNTYTIKMPSPDKEEIMIPGAVVWSSRIKTETIKKADSPRHESGLSFIKMNDNQRSSLERLISGLAD